ncbi:MAG: IS1096 element passenger TnpR family protein, partial [Candidatus Promineifilaceae bacterium]
MVPSNYSFWDLHVAIQDAMGWLDYHLHGFRVINPKTNRLDRIGIPTGEFESDREVKPGWLVAISDYFSWQSRLADGKSPLFLVII